MTCKLKRLIIALDISSSMTNVMAQSGQTRLDWVICKIENALRELQSPAVIKLYVFDNTLYFIDEYNDVQLCLAAIAGLRKRPVGGSTKLWDSLIKLIENISENEPWSIICGTDAEDYASQATRQSVVDLLSSKKGSTLTIIDLSGGGLRSVDPDQNTEPDGTTILDSSEGSENIDKMLLNIVTDTAKTVENLDISVAIIPLCKCTESNVETVCCAIRQAVPYLEQLTALRYYPVPTYLINSKQMQVLSPDTQKPSKVKSDPQLKSDILEIIEFIMGIALAFNTHSLIGPFNIRNDNYAQFTNLPDDPRRSLVWFCEVVYCDLKDALDANIQPKHWQSYYHIPELSPIDNWLFDSEANLREMTKILNSIEKAYPGQGSVFQRYFRKSPSLTNNDPVPPNLKAWERLISSKEMEIVHQAIDESSGFWKLKLKNVVEVMNIAINNIFPIIYGIYATKCGMSKLRTMGLYVPPNSATLKRIQQIDSGHKVSIAQDKTGGKVFIDIESFAGIAKELSSTPKLAEQMLFSVLIHEHTHAIAREGLPFANGLNVQSWPVKTNETLAEWAELSRGG